MNASNFTLDKGRSHPYGATLNHQGCNFAVYAPRASRIDVCLFDEHETEIARLSLPNRDGPIWFGFINGIQAGQKYGLRAHGAFLPDQGMMFNPAKLLIDPYANALSREAIPHPSMHGHQLDQMEELKKDTSDSSPHVPKSIVVDHNFDWHGTERLFHPWHELILYEVHVKGMTMIHPDIPEDIRGTYLGMAHPACIEYLKNLGISAIQLLPIHACMRETRLHEMGLTNYWGYNTANFFSPDPRYAKEDAVTELKTLVREMHKAGIEVILDVVYNHTCEGNMFGVTLSQRGLQNKSFYRAMPDNPTHFVDNSGCGNSVNVYHSPNLQMVMDSLRHWVKEYHIDGFRFDLAVALARDEWDFNHHSAFFKSIHQDPILKTAKMIAEPWDIGRNGYQLGGFPEEWYECNDKFRDNVRSYWKGDEYSIQELASRLMGSQDIFRKGINEISTSLNFLTYHDGFTLHDLVSYNNKHNQANQERNMDGHGHNLSYNYGVEGPTTEANIIELRQRQKRNMIATLFLSQGGIHFLGGDEIGRTQQGNNNSYCQDNEISWYNWTLSENDKQLYQFVKQMIAIRKTSSLLGNLCFSPTELQDGPAHSKEVHWYAPAGHLMRISDWHDPDMKAIALLLSTQVEDPEQDLAYCKSCFLILMNSHKHPEQFKLPASPAKGWKKVFDTSLNDGLLLPEACMTAKNITVAGRTLVLLAHPDWSIEK